MVENGPSRGTAEALKKRMLILRHVIVPGYLSEWVGWPFNEGKNKPPRVKKGRKREEKVVVLRMIKEGSALAKMT